MIDSIRGNVEATTEKDAVIVCGGMGYKISCSYMTVRELSAHKEDVKVYTYLAVRENAIELYGFYTHSERDMFLKLINVSKVGPKLALSILSFYTSAEIIMMIVSGDASGLSKPPGVGKKLAENMIVNLKDKFSDNEVSENNLLAGTLDDIALPKDEAVLALCSLGFDRTYAVKLVKSVYSESMSVEEIISAALTFAGK